MNSLARFFLEETTWGTTKCTCLSVKEWKVLWKKNKESMIDPPETRNEVFVGTKFSSAASVAGLRDVYCETIGSVSFCKVSGFIRLTSVISVNSICTLSKIDFRAAPIG